MVKPILVMINLYIFNESKGTADYGKGTYFNELPTALKGRDINVCLVQLFSDTPNDEPVESNGIRYWNISSPTIDISSNPNHINEIYYRNVMYLLQLHIKDTNRLIFHLNFMYSCPLAEELRRVFTCKIVLTIHYLDWCYSLLGNLSKFRSLLSQQDYSSRESYIIKEEVLDVKKLIKLTDKTICLSEDTRNILVNDYEIESNRLQLIFNGLPDSSHDQACKNLLRKKYRFPINDPIILFVSKIVYFKGLEYLLRAFRIVLNKVSNCRLLVVGNGSLNASLKECEDIWANVTFTGKLAKTKLSDLYTISDIGVIPSFAEQCSFSAIEMMMHSLPMITTTALGLAEMTENGISSLQVPLIERHGSMKIDTELLAEKILYLLEHPNVARLLGKNARKRYEERYEGELYRKNMLCFYYSLYKNKV